MGEYDETEAERRRLARLELTNQLLPALQFAIGTDLSNEAYVIGAVIAAALGGQTARLAAAISQSTTPRAD